MIKVRFLNVIFYQLSDTNYYINTQNDETSPALKVRYYKKRYKYSTEIRPISFIESFICLIA